MQNKTFRIFSLVCYDDSVDLCFNDILTLCTKNNLKYAYIQHLAEGDTKKDHYHFMIYYEKPTTLKKVSETLKLNENYLKVLDDYGQRYTLKKTIGYFIHYNNKEKINYNIKDIVTNCEDLVKKYYDILTGGRDEKSELKEIIAFINDNNASISDTLSFCIECDYLRTFKKYSYVLTTLCKYHYY